MNIMRRRGILRWRHVWQGLLCWPGKYMDHTHWSGNLCSSGLPEEKKGQYLLAGFAILLTAALTVKAVDVMYEYRSGYPSDIGIPSILWIAMGLQETDGMAGVYNRYQQTTFAEHDFNRSLPHRKERNIFANDCGSSGRIRLWPEISLRENWKINGSNHCFPASRQQSRLIRMENRCPPGLPVCTMGTYMKPYGSWPIITRVSYTWQDLYLELLCAEDGGKKRNSDSIVAAVDWHSRWLPVQYHLGSAEQICISVLCIFDPLCADGTL